MLLKSLMVSPIESLEKPIVYIVDCDHDLLQLVSDQLRLNNVVVEVFDSAESFLSNKIKSRAACLIVEDNLPNMTGITLLEYINNLGLRLPTIVLSSSSDVSKAVRAMQAKAIDFIEKPFVHSTLIAKVLDVVHPSYFPILAVKIHLNFIL